MGSITAPFSGCIYIEDLLERNAGPLEWQLEGIKGERIKAAAFAGDKPGCFPTTHHQRPLIIEGGTDALRNPTVDSLTIGFDWLKQSSESPCHRVFQVDVNIVGVAFNAGLITYKNKQIPDECKGKPVLPPSPIEAPPPAVELPPVYTEVPILPPGVPEQFDHAAIPEPATLILLGSALLGAGLRNKVRGRKRSAK